MKQIITSFDEMLNQVPVEIKATINLQFDISERISELMAAKGITKKQLADNLGRKPSEVTKWLSGQHNFTIKTIAMLTAFFGEPIISVINQ